MFKFVYKISHIDELTGRAFSFTLWNLKFARKYSSFAYFNLQFSHKIDEKMSNAFFYFDNPWNIGNLGKIYCDHPKKTDNGSDSNEIDDYADLNGTVIAITMRMKYFRWDK